MLNKIGLATEVSRLPAHQLQATQTSIRPPVRGESTDVRRFLQKKKREYPVRLDGIRDRAERFACKDWCDQKYTILLRLKFTGQSEVNLLNSLFHNDASIAWSQLMYAVFEDGSRQYRVSEGDVVQVDFRDQELGSPIEFNRVLLYQGADGLQVGQPLVTGARVLGEVVGHPSIKLYVQHFRRRKNYRRLRGHRQPYVQVQVRSILLPGMEAPATPAPKPAAETPAVPSAS